MGLLWDSRQLLDVGNEARYSFHMFGVCPGPPVKPSKRAASAVELAPQQQSAVCSVTSPLNTLNESRRTPAGTPMTRVLARTQGASGGIGGVLQSVGLCSPFPGLFKWLRPSRGYSRSLVLADRCVFRLIYKTEERNPNIWSTVEDGQLFVLNEGTWAASSRLLLRALLLGWKVLLFVGSFGPNWPSFPQSISSRHSATPGMLLVLPRLFEEDVDMLASFCPGFHQNLPWKVFDILWILGLT